LEVSGLYCAARADNRSNRRLDNKFNIFEGITNNWFFIVINFIMIGGQVLIVFVGGAAFRVNRLPGREWAICIILGLLSIPVGMLIRLVPSSLVLKCIPAFVRNRRARKPEVTVQDEESQSRFYFPQPLTDVHEELSFLKRVKGGRLNNLKFAMRNPVEAMLPHGRSGSRSRSTSRPQTPTSVSRENSTSGATTAGTPDGSAKAAKPRDRRALVNRSRSNSALGATTVMAGIIAGSVAGWSPIDKRDGESTPFPRGVGEGIGKSNLGPVNDDDDVRVPRNAVLVEESEPGSAEAAAAGRGRQGEL
jgi:Ca2+-transporting ATPase